MTCVVLPDGTASKRQKDILSGQASFYRKLYTMATEVEFTFQSNQSHCSISQAQKDKLQEAITTDELTASVNSLRSNRTPGRDGIQPEVLREVRSGVSVVSLNS